MYPKKKIKNQVLDNNGELNTPLTLFKKVSTKYVAPPVKFDDDIITVDPEVDAKMVEEDKKAQELKDEVELEEIEKEWEVVEDLPDFTTIEKKNKTTKVNKTIQKYIALKVGKDGKRLIDRIIEQAFYEWDQIKEVKPKYSDETVRFSQKLLFEWGYSKPAVKEEKSVEVTVEHKLDEALKQIHLNREKVKLLN